MPQVDFVVFSNQFIFLFFYFILFYFIVYRSFLFSLGLVISYRWLYILVLGYTIRMVIDIKKSIKNYCSYCIFLFSNLSLVSFVFVYFYFYFWTNYLYFFLPFTSNTGIENSREVGFFNQFFRWRAVSCRVVGFFRNIATF